MNNKKIYVGNLSYDTTEDGLRKVFEEAGEIVSLVIIRDKYTERSKGFGFIEFADEAAASKAIEIGNELELDGRKLRVNIAREPKQR